jgi:hypothetical protein
VQGAALSQKGCGPFDPYLAEHNDTFSSFLYKDSCTGKTQQLWIEPLAILTRHPTAFCMQQATLVDRGYLAFGLASDRCEAVAQSTQLQSVAMSMRPDYSNGGRLLIFDLGASYYTSGLGGASQVSYWSCCINCIIA